MTKEDERGRTSAPAGCLRICSVQGNGNMKGNYEMFEAINEAVHRTACGLGDDGKLLKISVNRRNPKRISEKGTQKWVAWGQDAGADWDAAT